MRSVVTAGPTYEELDSVRRLTNFSTGRLGSELAAFLTARGHDVRLLIGQQATYQSRPGTKTLDTFTTTRDLRERLLGLRNQQIDAVFHAAAVSDFGFGKVWRRSPGGELTEVSSGKISSREEHLLAELVPTPKIIAELRDWFPKANLVGWKYEVEGDQAHVVRQAERQIQQCRTDACVANGPAYGPGFGLVLAGKDRVHFPDAQQLYQALATLVR